MSADLALLYPVMKVNKPTSYKSYRFVCVSESAILYIFKHEDHATCSSMALEDFDTAIPRHFKMGQLNLPHSCNYCYTFLPYVYDNDNLLYEEELKGHHTFHDHSKLKSCPIESPFYVPDKFFGTGHSFSENVWTQRLANSLNTFYFTKDFDYTAEKALSFRCHQALYSDLEAPYFTIYFFRGTPDVIKKRKKFKKRKKVNKRKRKSRFRS